MNIDLNTIPHISPPAPTWRLHDYYVSHRQLTALINGTIAPFDLPYGAKLTRIFIDPLRLNEVQLRYEHESFPEVHEGEVVPHTYLQVIEVYNAP